MTPPEQHATPALTPGGARDRVAKRVTSAILAFVGEVPRSSRQASTSPGPSARLAARNSARNAAAAAGSLALPTGPLGWLTILPEMLAVWRIQAAMVADIAALYGKTRTLTREQMIYCLFKHTASQAVRDLVVRVGERYLVKAVSLPLLQSVVQRIGLHVSQRAVSRAAARWVPIAGALGVAGYAYYDTTQVARSAIELFEKEVDVETPAAIQSSQGEPRRPGA